MDTSKQMELAQATNLIRNNYLLKQNGTTVWADLGCGTGLFTQALASLLAPGSTVYAADKSPGLLVSGMQENGVVITPVQLDFITGEMVPGPLDGILMANSLHFAADKNTLIRKLRKSLKAEGCFIIAEYDTDTTNRWVPYPVSFRSLQALFKNAGFTYI